MSIEPLRACVCQELYEAMAEGLFDVIEFKKDEDRRLIYMLPHPSGDTDKALLMVFCPFCAGTVGDGWAVAVDTGN